MRLALMISDSQSEVTIAAATIAEKPIIARLLQLYLHDSSEFSLSDPRLANVGDDGLYAYPFLDLYWTEDGRTPILIRVAGRLAGFALVNRWAASGQLADHAMAEFFVLRKFRRVGVGSRAAHAIFRLYPGQWEIAIGAGNRAAQTFWRQVASNLPGLAIEHLSGAEPRWSGPILRFRVDRGGECDDSR